MGSRIPNISHDTLLTLLLARSPTTTNRISQQVFEAKVTPTPQSVLMAWRAAAICTERGTAVERYCVCYYDVAKNTMRTLQSGAFE